MAMRVLQTDFFGDHNIGLFARSGDKFSLVGSHLPDSDVENISKVVGGDVLKANVANSEIVGIFSVFNSNGILLPSIARTSEIKMMTEFGDKMGMKVSVVESKYTAIGNLVLCNDNGAVISKLLSKKDKSVIEKCLGVEAGYGTAAGLDSVGSCGIANNNGCVIHRDATEKELDNFQKILKAESDVGTANFGSPFVGACVIANGKGIVAGESTTGPEVTRIMETLGLL